MKIIKNKNFKSSKNKKIQMGLLKYRTSSKINYLGDAE